MKKNYIQVIYVLIAVALVNLAVMLGMIQNLPAKIPVHFNYRFEVDRMGTKWFMAVIPTIPVLFSIYMAAEQRIRGRDYANNKPLTFFAIGFVAFWIALSWMMYAMCGTGAQMGDTVNVPLDLFMGLGFAVLFIVMGNYLPTVKPNRTFGIRVPATYRNEEVWKKTHRFAGPATVLGGIFTAVISLIGHFVDKSWLIFVGLMMGVFVPMIVIFIYAKRIEKQLKG